MIPKIIHYCWFGGKPLPDDAKRCIDSWQKYCPEYQIKEWNESNFNLNCCEYVRSAYEEKKWAFVSDYVRLYALVSEGGVYMDSDIELIKNIDQFLCHKAFGGFQSSDSIQTGLLGSESGFVIFRQLLEDYNTRSFYKEDGGLNTVSNVTYITTKLKESGLELNNRRQNINGFVIYPKDYFCAKSYETGIIKTTDNTFAIHHFSGSWLDEANKKRLEEKNRYISKYGYVLGMFIYKINKITKNMFEIQG